MGGSIFERIEKKYIITDTQYEEMQKYISAHCLPDEYPDSYIYNIYYDTDDDRIVRDSAGKPIYKEKLRLRAYSLPKDDTKVFVELKKKFKGVVYKRRISLPYSDAVAFLNEGVSPSQRTQIVREIEYFMNYYKGIHPAMFISYHRLSYISNDSTSSRITFDSEITYRTHDLLIDKGIYGTPLLEEGTRLMELKILGSMPIWLSHSLDECRIYPTTFSKFGTAYNQLLSEKTKTEGVL